MLDVQIEMNFSTNLTAGQANCDKDFPDISVAMATLHCPSQDIYIYRSSLSCNKTSNDHILFLFIGQ